MSKSLIRKNQLHPDIADLVSGYGTGLFVTPSQLANTGLVLSTNIATTGSVLFTNIATTGSVLFTNIATTGSVLSTNIATTGSVLKNLIDNLSGTVSNIDLTSTVRVTGDQTIDGFKNFTSRPTVNGVGVLTFGEGGDLIAENVIYTTGDIDIFDQKRFENATNLENSPFLYSGLGKYTENYFTAVFSGDSGIYESPITRNTIVFLNIETGQEHDVYLPNISDSVENDNIKYIIDSVYEENVLINTYDDENNLLISGDFIYQPKFTLNFKTSGIDESGNYTEPFNLESINSFAKNGSISFYFSQDNSWKTLDKLENNFLPEHSHEIEEIAGVPDLNNLVYATGNQIISGLKTFSERPFFNGTGLATLADVNEGGGNEYLFPSDLNVILGGGKTFGKFRNGDTILAAGKTIDEVFRLAITETINPTINSFSVNPISILIGQTNISNTITFSGQILNPGATLSGSRLEWRRGTSASFEILIEDPISPYTHIDTNMILNSNSYNYRYIIGDSMGGLTTGNPLNVPFLYGNYFGYSGVESLTGIQDIEALGNRILSDGRARTINNVTAGAELYFYYAYRSGAGNLTSVIQDGATTIFINGEGAFINQGTITGTNVNGVNVTYRVYRSVDPGAFSSNTLVFN